MASSAPAGVPGFEVPPGGIIRVFLNGCWDLPHSGHFNAFRQARAACAEYVDGDDGRVFLVCGVHPNAEIRREKGGCFVMSEEEKDRVLSACRFIDAVAHDIPYDEMSPELLDRPEIRCHVACHGDDPVMLKRGVGMYVRSREAGRYVEFPRTQGISTTHLIDRLLMAASQEEYPLAFDSCILTMSLAAAFARVKPVVLPAATAKIGYVDGDWDLFHAGHVHVLEELSKMCDFVVVGVHGDAVVRKYRGAARPVMSTGERVLDVSCCRFAGDTIFDAPLHLSATFLQSMRIGLVLRVSGHTDFALGECLDCSSRFSEAEEQGLLVDFAAPPGLLTTGELLSRVAKNQADMEQRQGKKRIGEMTPKARTRASN